MTFFAPPCLVVKGETLSLQLWKPWSHGATKQKKQMDSQNTEFRLMWLFAGNMCLQFGLGKIGLVGELVD